MLVLINFWIDESYTHKNAVNDAYSK